MWPRPTWTVEQVGHGGDISRLQGYKIIKPFIDELGSRFQHYKYWEVCLLHGISQRSWRSDKTWQWIQQGVVLLLSATGLCLDCKHPADWMNEPLVCSRIGDDAESKPLWHSKQKELQAVWVDEEQSLVKLRRNQLKTRLEKSFFLLLNSFLLPLIQTFPLFY